MIEIGLKFIKKKLVLLLINKYILFFLYMPINQWIDKKLDTFSLHAEIDHTKNMFFYDTYVLFAERLCWIFYSYFSLYRNLYIYIYIHIYI